MIFKELRQLLPIAWLWLAVIAMGFASRLIGSRADEESFASWYDTYLDVGSDPLIAAVAALVGLVTAWSLFPREIDDSTIDFLRALPVSRLQVFVAKYLAAVALISGLVVFSYSIDALLLAWNPESMGGVFYTQVFFTLLWRDIVFSAVIVAHGVLISWFRVTGLVVYVIYLLAVAWLESRAGGAGVFSVLSMLSNEYYGSRLVVNVEAIVVHVLAAFCMLVIAHLLWSKTASARSGGKQRTRVGSFWRALVPIAAFLGLGAGLATWKTIRMDLDAFEADVSQRRVLSHEAVHVMQSVLSDRAMARHFAATRFFIEGMAQYLSFAIVPEEERRSSNRAIAAIAWKRQEIRFEDMINPGFAARHDPDLYYSLGDLWTESFVAVCGEPALGDFLRAAGREDVPRSLSGTVFWHDTLGYLGCELEQVNGRFEQDMQSLYDETDRSRFPVFEGARVTRLDDGRVRIVATLGAEKDANGEPGVLNSDELPARFTVRVGGNASLVAAVDPVFRGRLEVQNDQVQIVYEIPARAVPRNRFEYQLGYSPYADSRVWYDTRRSGTAAAGSADISATQ